MTTGLFSSFKNVVRLSAIAAIVLLAMCWPLAVNRMPILYPDTAAYLSYGKNIWRLVGKVGHQTSPATVSKIVAKANVRDSSKFMKLGHPLGGRSLYYSSFAWAAKAIGGWVAIAIAQAVWLGLIIIASLRRLQPRSQGLQLVTVIVLALTTSLSFFNVVLLPDAFAAVVPLSIIILVAFEREMGRRECAFWCFSLIAAVLFHQAFLALAIVMSCLTAFSAWHSRWAGSGRGVGIVVVALMLALVGNIVINPLTSRFGGFVGQPPPFLLARGIGDQTIAQVLRVDCPVQLYVNCRIVSKLPLTENDFLWNQPGLAWSRQPADMREKISNEQYILVIKALERFPTQQLKRSLANAARQFFDLDYDEFKPLPNLGPIISKAGFSELMGEYELSPIWRGWFPLDELSLIWKSIYILSISICLLILIIFRKILVHEGSRLSTCCMLILVSLGVNAAINGMLAGVYGRYQARISWLATLAAILLVMHIKTIYRDKLDFKHFRLSQSL